MMTPDKTLSPVTSDVNKVTVVAIQIPFLKVVGILIKWALAAIPAIIILALLGALLAAVFAGMFAGAVAGFLHR